MMVSGLLAGAVAWGGPWLRPVDSPYLKLSATQFRSADFVQPSGATLDGTSYRRLSGQLYGEVGVLPNLQIVLDVPAVAGRNERLGQTYINRQAGDLRLGAEVGRGPTANVPVSLQVQCKVPLYDNAVLLQYGDSAFPATGAGQVDLLGIGAVGSSWAWREQRGWAYLELGHQHRTEWWLGDSSRPERALVDGVVWRGRLGWTLQRDERRCLLYTSDAADE